ncbi:hypothetical protein QDR37_14955 [Amnibacterium sp. CER49]|uniref:hypothetical protein n=1 Tax=Amnibacterium sp. CER49 TaxID=3039161 RepID=UPI0024477C06|nr:hypothetical protein [Amnibacterium sp. CER49]MDH2445250.1 hypothetical protein [Amnibacterium sp. CER49]
MPARPRLEVAALVAAFLLVHAGLGALDLLDQVHQPAGDVTGAYRFWIDEWRSTGQLVGVSLPWVYPIGALPWMIAAAAFGDAAYPVTWLLLVTVLDAGAAVLLARRSRRLLWWWLAFTACLGPVALARLDAVALPFAIAGVLLVADRPAVASALLTVGAWIKVWPAAIVLGLVLAGRRTAAVVAAAVGTSAAVILLALLAGAGGNVFSFVSAQTGRGLQIEAPVTALWLWNGALGLGATTVYYDQTLLTFQVTGDGVAATAAAMTAVLLAGVLGICALGLVARLRGAPAGEVLAFTSLGLVAAFLALNKVGSPQYLTWFVGPVLLGLLTAPRRFRPTAVLVLLLAALTQLIYPWFYGDVTGLRPPMLAVLTVRDLLELVLLGTAALGLATAHPAHRMHPVEAPFAPVDDEGAPPSSAEPLAAQRPV